MTATRGRWDIPLLTKPEGNPIVTPPAKAKIVRCVNCRGMMRVPVRALSVFCPHCQKRVELESLRITGSHPGRRLATCGDIVVEATGWLNAEVVATNVMILGRVRGPVVASKYVEVGPKAQVIGDILAPKIVVREGAVIQGSCRMTRPIEDRPEAMEDPGAQTGEETTETSEPEIEHIGVDSRIRPLPLRPLASPEGATPTMT